MDVPDIEVVVQYQAIQLDKKVVGCSSILIVCDLIQRAGLAARGQNQKARAYICIDDRYWISPNDTSSTRPETPVSQRAPSLSSMSANVNRNHRRPRQTESEEDLDGLSGAETSEDESYLSMAEPETLAADQDVDTLSFSWSEFAQMQTCLRKYLLTLFGEDRVPEDRRGQPAPQEECCNVCNPELSIEGSFQLQEQEGKAPAKYSQSWLVLQYVQAWAEEVTRKWIGRGDLVYDLPAYTLIPLVTQWRLSETFCLDREKKAFGLSRNPKDGSFHHVKIL